MPLFNIIDANLCAIGHDMDYLQECNIIVMNFMFGISFYLWWIA